MGQSFKVHPWKVLKLIELCIVYVHLVLLFCRIDHESNQKEFCLNNDEASDYGKTLSLFELS